MTEPTPYTLPGTKVLLLGGTGSGKTHSIITLLKAGIKPFVIFTEPGQATLARQLKKNNYSLDDVAWQYIPPAAQDFASMQRMSQKLNTMSFKLIAGMTDPDRSQFSQWIRVLEACANFVDDKTGKSYGNIGTWNTDRALVLDSLSGLNEMAMSLIVGARPTRDVSDWMVAQNNLHGFIQKLTVDMKCHFVLTGHLERIKDEVSGAVKLMPLTLGQKLAPKIPLNFDEVILTRNVGGEFSWSTAEDNIELKARYLEIRSKLQPSFVPLIESWKESGGVILPTETNDDQD